MFRYFYDLLYCLPTQEKEKHYKYEKAQPKLVLIIQEPEEPLMLDVNNIKLVNFESVKTIDLIYTQYLLW